MRLVRNEIQDGGDMSSLGRALDVKNNEAWLVYNMYSVPYVGVNLPPLDSISIPGNINGLSTQDVELLVEQVMASNEALKALEAKGTDEAFFLAVRDMDKLAIAAYTLYLYGIEQ
jgi:hypothetical protein